MIKEELLKEYPYAELGSSDGSARIRIYVYNYEFPDSKDAYDADWYMNYISLNLDGVSAAINEPVIEGRMFESLIYETKELAGLKTKELEFRFTEPVFSFTLHNTTMSINDIDVKGELVTKNARIGFDFKTDIEKVKRLIEGMERILKRYPSR